MAVILSIVCIVFAVLQIILFFKIWGMTNDVAEMTDILRNMNVGNIAPTVYSQEKPEVQLTTDGEELMQEPQEAPVVSVLKPGTRVIIAGQNSTMIFRGYDGSYCICRDERSGKIQRFLKEDVTAIG